MRRGDGWSIERSYRRVEVRPLFGPPRGQPKLPTVQLRNKTSYRRNRVGCGAHVRGLRRPCLVSLEIGRRRDDVRQRSPTSGATIAPFLILGARHPPEKL
jgi:hypothetical protein